MADLRPIRVEYVGGGGAHKDLVLTIGSHRQVADTYFLAIEEDGDAADDERSRIAGLLGQWVADLETLYRDAPFVVLPFDFSDQCTAWLEVRLTSGTLVEASLGWSGLEGWAVRPSNYAESTSRVGVLDPIDGATVTCELPDLIAAVDASRTEIEATT